MSNEKKIQKVVATIHNLEEQRSELETKRDQQQSEIDVEW
jgi:malate synthase